MPLPVSGPISFNAINVELGVAGTTQASLGQSSYRTLAGVPSGQISMSNFYGKANQFAFTINTNQSNANLRTLAVNAGWNQSSRVVATIASGVEIRSTSTVTPALTISGSFPGGVELVNGGTIVGMGGSGGRGGWNAAITDANGGPGAAGGTALSVSVAASVRNNSIISGGGGGGGGGALGNTDCVGQNGGGGGGGGNGYGAGGDFGRGDVNGQTGVSGGQLSGGAGGAAGTRGGVPRANGGAGGTNASSGTSGGNTPFINGGAGGAGGAAISGNSNITWLATGTRYGTIS